MGMPAAGCSSQLLCQSSLMHTVQKFMTTAPAHMLAGTAPQLTAGLDGFIKSELSCCRGHNGKVRSIVWSPDDTKLVSGGMDGAVYEWRVKDLKREKENVLKVRR